MTTETSVDLRAWIGRTERRGDDVGAAPLSALAATFNRDDLAFNLGSDVPPLWHWLHFIPLARQDQIGADGHPLRGGFLPPIALPRRMWAGGELQFHHPLQVGDEITRQSRILDVDAKDGKSGPLVFVKVRHEISNARGIAITEEQDIVYRGMPAVGAPAPAGKQAATDEDYRETVVPDPVLLFRYSALTFNSHRIHYDRRYVTEVEGYPGLVVHGPMVATLLLGLASRQLPRRRVRGFAFRAVHPLFDTAAFELCGKAEADGSQKLWARNHDGAMAMEARASFF
ncbi:MaoC family dehydratase N-terminal domain-containing protein [Variovorax sp. CT11-76]